MFIFLFVSIRAVVFYIESKYQKTIAWYCGACCSDIFAFTNINNYKLYLSINNTGKKYCGTDLKEAYLVLKPQKNLSDLFNEFNDLSDQNKNQDNLSDCKYYELNEMKSLNNLNTKFSLSFSHSKTCFLSKNFGDLQHIRDSPNFNFDVVFISETIITKKKPPISNIYLTRNNYEHCPTES